MSSKLGVLILASLTAWLGAGSLRGQGVDCSVAPNTATACSAGSSGVITFAENYYGPAAPYPSAVTLKNMSGTVASVQLTLNGLDSGPSSCWSDVDLLLVNAGSGHAFVPLANAGGGCGSKGGSVSFTLADNGTSLKTGLFSNQAISSQGTFAPSSLTQGRYPNWDCAHGSGLLGCEAAIAPGPAPTYPTAIAYAAGDGSATFASGAGAIFRGDDPNQTWYLYVFRNKDGVTGASGSLASWTLTVTTSLTANGPAATTTTVSSSQSPSFTAAPNNSVTFTAHVTQNADGSNVTAGTLTFLEGSTVLQAATALDSNGLATFTSSALSEGTHTVTAQYNGSAGNFDVSSGSVTQEVDTHTTNPAPGQYCNPGGMVLPASGGASVYPSNIFVANLAGAVSTVSVTLNGLTDPSLYGINALLSGPAVTLSPGNLVFLSNAGAATPVSGAIYTFADGSAAFLAAVVPPSGTFAPTSEAVQNPPVFPAPAPANPQFSAPANVGTLGLNGTFANADPNGKWSLDMYVVGGGSAGSLGSWCLNIGTNPPVLSIGMTGPSTLTQGQTGAQYTITVTNNGPGPTGGAITVTELPSAGLAVTAMSGSGWDCSALPSCTSTTPIPANGSSQILATVSVAGNAALTQSNSASVSGGGSVGTMTDPNPISIGILQATTTVASNEPATFSANTQTVALFASVASGSNPVTGGTVTFTILSNGILVGAPATSFTVTNGSAFANYTLPGGTAPGTYTIQAVYSGTTSLGSSSDSSHVLNITTTTTTTAFNETATFSPNAQTVKLGVTVSSPAGAVSAGTVTFTVLNNGAPVGVPVTSGAVTNGLASVMYSLPGGTAVGTYSIQASYSGAVGTEPSNGSATLTVNAGTTITGANVSVSFRGSPQNVTLSATLTSTLGSVSGGTVTFTVLSNGTPVGSPATSGTVANGVANATYVLPAGTPVGTYTIQAVYNGAGSFAGSSDSSHSLIVSTGTTTNVANVTATFSASAQNVLLTAGVTTSDLVNGGTITFTVLSNGTVLGSPVTSGPVTNGSASATYVLPGGTALGSYTIQAVYSGAGNFGGSSGNGTLTVTGVTTIAASNVVVAFNSSVQNVTLSANLTSTAGTVNGGTVTFTVLSNGTPVGSPTTSAAVANGVAGAIYALPGSTPAGVYTIQAVYSGAGLFAAAGDNAHTLTVNIPTSTVTANASATFSSNAQNVTLSAGVLGEGTVINGGTVTFTVLSNGTPVGSPVTSGPVTNGSASAIFALPGGTSVGTYTIQAAYSGNTTLGTSSGNGTLTIVAATTVVADSVSLPFSASPQDVTLSATLSSAAGKVHGGIVTFTVLNNGTAIGSPVTGAVSGGMSSATYVLPGGTPGGIYTIQAVYSGAGLFAAGGDNTHTLTVGAASSVMATSATVTFSPSAQNVLLVASVSSLSGTVNGGTVTFTILNNGAAIGTPVTSGTVTNGVASATYALPGGTPAGVYTIQAAYSGTAGLAPSTDISHTLTVIIPTLIAAANASAAVSASDQNVTLSALVTSAGGPVNGGTVTFSVLNNGVEIGSAAISGTVTNGNATATYVLPGGTATGTYTIQAVYSGSGVFAASGDNTHTLTVALASNTVASNASIIFSPSAQTVTLSADVTSPAGTITAGTVTFTVSNNGITVGSPAIGTVANGSFSVTYSVPGGTPAGVYTIQAVYSGAGNFGPSSDSSHLLTINSALGALMFVPVTPCRVVDTRNANGAFGGPELAAGSTRNFNIPAGGCGIPTTAVAYSVNVTVVPAGPLGYLTVWPQGGSKPTVSTLNSDGRVKANAAIVPAGTGGGISIFVTDATQLVLDIDGYFLPAASATSALAFYPLTPCRITDTRQSGTALDAGSTTSFAIAGSCSIPATAQAYSLNFTAVPKGPLSYLTTWPTGQAQPLASTLNASTGAVTANAAIVPAGTGGSVSVFSSEATDLVIDVDGYFAAPGSGGLSLYTLTPCRVLDTRNPSGSQPFNGTIAVNVAASGCNVPSAAQAYVLNATVVPPGGLTYLTLWPDGQTMPAVSTLNALDGAITSNMGIVPTANGSIDAFGSNPTQLILDISSYFAP